MAGKNRLGQIIELPSTPFHSDSVGIPDGDDSGHAWRFCWTHSAGTGPGKASAVDELPRGTLEHQSDNECVTSGLMA